MNPLAMPTAKVKPNVTQRRTGTSVAIPDAPVAAEEPIMIIPYPARLRRHGTRPGGEPCAARLRLRLLRRRGEGDGSEATVRCLRKSRSCQPRSFMILNVLAFDRWWSLCWVGFRVSGMVMARWWPGVPWCPRWAGGAFRLAGFGCRV